MINYSVCVQNNPFDPSAEPKAYARIQMRELMTFKKFINHIVKHNGIYTRGTVRGVLVDMCECLVEMLLEGKKVELGELGTFWLSLRSQGAETKKAFTADNITDINVVFTPGNDFAGLLDKAEFNVVSTRVAQAATLKAEKASEGTVDLEAARAAAKGSSGTTTGGTTGGDNTNAGGSGSDGDNDGGLAEEKP